MNFFKSDKQLCNKVLINDIFSSSNFSLKIPLIFGALSFF